MRVRWTAAAAALLIAACGEKGKEGTGLVPEAAAAAEAAAAPAEKAAVASETVEAVFTGWEMGDYLWANFEVEGREATGAWVGPSPVEHFLEAHKGKPITLRIDKEAVYIPEAGGTEEIEKIADARAGELSAASWWAGLSAAERKAAEARMEEVLAGG